MATIKQTIDGAYSVYMHSATGEELERAAGELVDLLGDARTAKIISAENRENAQFLLFKLQLKMHAAAYFCEGYESADFLKLQDFADAKVKECEELGFKKTGALIKEVAEKCKAVNGIMYDAVALKMRVSDNEGRLVASDGLECRAVSSELAKKIEKIKALTLPANVFSDGAYFPDLTVQICGDLSELKAFCDKAYAAYLSEQTGNIIKSSAVDITENLNAKRLVYYPDEGCVEGLANAVVLFTPIPDEAEILAWSVAGGAKIYKLSALSFEGLQRKDMDAVFDGIRLEGADCVIYGMPHFRDKSAADFYRAVMAFGRSGRRAYLVADDGTRRIYDEALKAAGGEFTSLDVSFLYLSMPDFVQTVEELKEIGLISGSGEDLETVKKIMPFAGFAGLNEAVAAHAAGKDWKKFAGERSDDNRAAAINYMQRLPRQALFLDVGWGKFGEDVAVSKRKRFDYDDIRCVNPDNVKRIMEGNFSLFQKCGMLSTYCILCGGSAADWPTLPKEIKSERLTEASKLVMRALGVGIVPVVEVKDELEDAQAGGLCCDGGKRIQYKTSAVPNFEWVARAVCHECFHAFQHMAIAEPWQDWFERELHVTRGRIDQWNYNFGRYKTIGKNMDAYMIQIVESDARAFENDCLGECAEQILNLIDLD